MELQVLFFPDSVDPMTSAVAQAQEQLERIQWVGAGEVLKFTPVAGGSLRLELAVEVDGGFEVVRADVSPRVHRALREVMARPVTDVLRVGREISFVAALRWEHSGGAVSLQKIDPRGVREGAWTAWRSVQAAQVRPSRAPGVVSGRGDFDRVHAQIGDRRIVVFGNATTHGVRDFRDALGRDLDDRVDVRRVGLQGRSAVRDLVAALADVDPLSAGLVVVVRGGGAATDLAPFHTSVLAQAVATSRVPVAVGLGHTADHTLVDRVASLTAATPATLGRQLRGARMRSRSAVARTTARLAPPVVPTPAVTTPPSSGYLFDLAARDRTIAALERDLTRMTRSNLQLEQAVQVRDRWLWSQERRVVAGAQDRLGRRYRRLQLTGRVAAVMSLVAGVSVGQASVAGIAAAASLGAAVTAIASRRRRRLAREHVMWAGRPSDVVLLAQARTWSMARAAFEPRT
jgi:hypothetical protein